MRQALLRIIMAIIGCAMFFAFGVPTAEAGCGGGGVGFRPLKNLRERIQQRRESRQNGGQSQAAGGCSDQTAGYAPQYAPQYQVTYPDAGQSIAYGTDIPMPAVYRKGAVAIFDGQTWRLQETGAAISITPQYQPQSYGGTVVPSGMHAHTTYDGRTIIHGNENLGSASAHVGIAPPWVRTAEAGQTVYGIGYGASSSCPPGGCPSDSGRTGLFRRR